MPLQSTGGSVRDEGNTLSFTMRDAEKLIRCHVQQGALDSIAQGRTGDADERLERFHQHRAVFEAVARDLHAAGLPIRITADHVSWLRRSPLHRRQISA